MQQITRRTYRESIVHLKISIAVLTVVKTCEERFMSSVVPANKTQEKFLRPETVTEFDDSILRNNRR